MPGLGRALALALVSLLVGVLGCARTVSPDQDPGAVIARFLAARDARNLDETMAGFVDQPELRSSLNGRWSGRDVVRAIMAYRMLDTYTVGEVRVFGDRVIWTEHVRRGGAGTRVASYDEDVEALVVAGRIESMVFYLGGRHPTLPVESVPPWSLTSGVLLPLATLLLVAGAVLVWPPRAPARRRSANGRLLSGLREYVARRG